jgi:hypothetical protein
MKTQPLTKSEISEHGENAVRVVCEKLICPANNVIEDVKNKAGTADVVTADREGYGDVAYVLCDTVASKRMTELAIDGPKRLEDRINSYRKLLAATSYLYYEDGETPIPDTVWDEKARKLVRMQEVHPGLGTWENEAFEDFTGATGMHLPKTEEVIQKAEEMKC